MAPDYKSLYEAEKLSREQAETLVQIAAGLNGQTDLETALSTICQTTAAMLDLSIVTISLYDEEKDELIMAYEVGLPDLVRDNLDRIPREVYDAYLNENGRILVLPDVQTMDELPARDLFKEVDLRTTIGVSMLLDEQLIGRMNIGIIGQVREFTERELKLLRGIADQAALAIHRAQLYEQLQEHAEELELRGGPTDGCPGVQPSRKRRSVKSPARSTPKS